MPRFAKLSFAILISVTTIGGCSSRATPSASVDSKTDSRIPWFCQTGENSEQWDCIQDEEQASNPQPVRSPPKVAQVQTPTFAEPIPDPRTSSVRRFDRPQPAQPQPQVSTAPAAPPPAAEPPTQNPDIPRHIALAYRPETAVSLLDLPDDFWAVQLIALSSREALEEYARSKGVRGMSAAQIAVNDELFYILLLGIYETRENAELATQDLPEHFSNPWIRSVGSLKRAMLKAEGEG